ncbi:MAG: hypothetical protein M0R03_13520 [Novosphingobium sp.]|nr:hypothetical protein [Novosphingobium sp.]
MGHRFLAALLALLAGFAAQIAPVQARAPDGRHAQIGAVETRAELSIPVSPVAGAVAVSPLARGRPVAVTPGKPVALARCAAVVIGVDRALE